ncbi:hypothetical protein D3C81_1322330 [compost metagenome]
MIERQLLGLARAPVVQEHIHLGDVPTQLLTLAGRLQVQFDHCLQAVERIETYRTALRQRRHATQRIAAGHFQAGYLCPEHRQQVASQRPLNTPARLDDAQAA